MSQEEGRPAPREEVGAGLRVAAGGDEFGCEKKELREGKHLEATRKASVGQIFKVFKF